MKKNLRKNTYRQLVKDITELYEYARRALVEAYWRIGKRIVEQEQQGETNAIYGDHLLDRLSEDLSETLGSGFSKRNLYNMRRFYPRDRQEISWKIWGPSVPPIGSRPIERYHRRSRSEPVPSGAEGSGYRD